MSSNKEIIDKKGQQINVGDMVSNRARGGRQYGEVESIVRTAEEAEKQGVKNPPKVLFTDQHGELGCLRQVIQRLYPWCIGHRVNHNPETVVHGEDPF